MLGEIDINSRRFLGNKYKLLPFIKKIATENCKELNVVADMFAGTGVVSSAFQDKQVITNDILFSNYVCNLAWFSPIPYNSEKIRELLSFYNSADVYEQNYMTLNFSNTYFCESDCAKIGYIREDIEKRYQGGKLNEREKAILIASLLYGMDKIAKTCGHYDSFRKDVDFDAHLVLSYPHVYEDNNEKNISFNMDSNKLAKKISADLVYLDPPYNSRQYCDAYHLLENVARWNKPEVRGVARKMDRANLKSDYCTQKAVEAFEDLIEHLSCKYIMLSYNNMAEKGCERSNARIPDKDILRILKKKGAVRVYSESYKPFTTGKSQIKDNEERVFFVTVE